MDNATEGGQEDHGDAASVVEVYRKGQPNILTIKEIRELAMRPEFKSDGKD
jgi:hypothetical protein